MDVQTGALVGFGNPLLDISVKVNDTLLLEKYGLAANNAILAEEKHFPLFSELAGMENVKFVAGGSCQNSLRVFQWITGVKYGSVFYGAIGKDKYGERLEKRARSAGVDAHYMAREEKPTGMCGVIVTSRGRSLIANLGAASLFTHDFMETDENFCIIERGQVYYATGFFLAVSHLTVERVAKYSFENNRTFILNLSATFVMMTMQEQLDTIFPYVDIVVGNKMEMFAFAETHNLDCSDIFTVGHQIQTQPKEGLRPRIVIITSAACPILVFLEEGRVKEYIVPKIDPKKIVDPAGCGDAFIGAFLAQYCQHMPLDYCVRAGIWAAQKVLSVTGVNLDEMPTFQESCI